MTKTQAETDFRETHMPAIKAAEAEGTGRVDGSRRRTEWNDYTDALCKDGQITDRQYNNWLAPRWLESKRI